VKSRPPQPGSGSAKTPAGPTHFWRYILIGFFTVAPLWVTWLVFDFVFSLLARAGAPLMRGAALGLQPLSEELATWLTDPALQYGLAALFTLVVLYAVGLLTSLVVGRRLIAFLERVLARLPLVQTIYGATKRFLQSLQHPPVSGQRVVLISFPSPEMKAVGFITKVMSDPQSGRPLAAVYVPTSPNPTSGYIEIVPMEDVVQTDWSMEEAMAFVMTGGTNAPEHVHFSNPPSAGAPSER
jgi:uncharacterized membrane protein